MFMRLRPIEWIVLAAIAVSAFLLFFRLGGGVGYFSPDTLEYKSRSHDFLDWPTRDRNELTEYLIRKGYWSPIETKKPRWILMFEFWPGMRDGQSSLHAELSWRGDEWIEWSESHPEQAAQLWPQVLGVLRADPKIGREEAAELMLNARYEDH